MFLETNIYFRWKSELLYLWKQKYKKQKQKEISIKPNETVLHSARLQTKQQDLKDCHYLTSIHGSSLTKASQWWSSLTQEYYNGSMGNYCKDSTAPIIYLQLEGILNQCCRQSNYHIHGQDSYILTSNVCQYLAI